MQILYKIAGVIVQGIGNFHQPVAAVGWPSTALQIVHHLIDGVHLAVPGGDDQFIGHINANGHQLIRP
ncbi:hypothetical protein D3C79_1029190 [compost metagenome]